MTPRPPYVLLDDARPGGETRLYADPVEIVVAHAPAAIAGALDRLRAGRAAGLHAAGFLSYEAGAAFVPGPGAPPIAGQPDLPLLWFGLFPAWRRVDPATFLPDPAGAWIGTPTPRIDQATYEAQVRAVRKGSSP